MSSPAIFVNLSENTQFGFVPIVVCFRSSRVHWLQSVIYVSLPSQATSLAVLKCWQDF